MAIIYSEHIFDRVSFQKFIGFENSQTFKGFREGSIYNI